MARVYVEQQLDELELLQCMFAGPGEFITEDHASRDQAVAFRNDLIPDGPKQLSCSLHILIDAHQPGADSDDEEDNSLSARDPTTQYRMDINITLQQNYPDSLPEVYVSSNDLKRRGQDDLNSDLLQFMKQNIETGVVCLLQIVEWIRDNAGSYCPIPSIPIDMEPDSDSSGSQFSRMWLYMHHIYSKTKRRNILSLADEYQLTGFCLPGKPGIVCVEGEERNAKQFYGILRSWCWKSIACRRKEVVSSNDVSSLRKIAGFQELVFDMHGHRQNHMDMGQFLEYLRVHELDYMFKVLFGVEGHSPT